MSNVSSCCAAMPTAYADGGGAAASPVQTPVQSPVQTPVSQVDGGGGAASAPAQQPSAVQDATNGNNSVQEGASPAVDGGGDTPTASTPGVAPDPQALVPVLTQLTQVLTQLVSVVSSIAQAQAGAAGVSGGGGTGQSSACSCGMAEAQAAGANAAPTATQQPAVKAADRKGGGASEATPTAGSFPSRETKDRDQIDPFIKRAAQAYGANADVLSNIAKYESNYRWNAVNDWDSNAQKGTPSKGMFQFIEPTFNAYAKLAHKANPDAWQGLGDLDWMDWRQQALTTAWAIKNGRGYAWATYDRARADA